MDRSGREGELGLRFERSFTIEFTNAQTALGPSQFGKGLSWKIVFYLLHVCAKILYFWVVFIASQILENELKINIALKGAGAKVENGVQVSGHYEGRGFDGTVFDS